MNSHDTLKRKITSYINKKNHAAVYNVLHRLFQWGIPIGSAIMTWFASGEAGDFYQDITVFVAGTITVITAVNSSIQPLKKYAFNIRYCNEFRGLSRGLEIEMERIDTVVMKNLRKGEKLVRIKDESKNFLSLVSKYQEDIIATAISEQKQVSNSGD